MREALSKLICDATTNDSKMYVLTGDHGYALFDAVRKASPRQFINAGISEQGMIGYASGMHKVGLKTIIYGLAAFIPIRVLEQIKIDLCLSSVPAILLGDGAGIVYTTLGSSHQCAEDVAALRAMPNLTIYSPCDQYELETCFQEALQSTVPVYIRIGKSDRPAVHSASPEKAGIHAIHSSPNTTPNKKIALVATGSMVSISASIGKTLDINVYSVSKLKPFRDLCPLKEYDHLMVVEEHSKFGGLFSCLAELVVESVDCKTKLSSFSLKEHFAEKCGGYQYALSEHQMSDSDLEKQIHERFSMIMGKNGI